MTNNEAKYAKEFTLAKAYADSHKLSRFGLYAVVDGVPIFYYAPNLPKHHKIGLPHLVSFINETGHRLEPHEVLRVMHYALHSSEL